MKSVFALSIILANILSTQITLAKSPEKLKRNTASFESCLKDLSLATAATA